MKDGDNAAAEEGSEATEDSQEGQKMPHENCQMSCQVPL